jgi:hypothetical protein
VSLIWNGRGSVTLSLRGGDPESPGAEAGFEIHYRCSRKWSKAFVHYSLDDGVTWSLKPDGAAGGALVQSKHAGVDTEMTSSPAGVHWKRVSLAHSAALTLSFVFHDGQGTWDSGPEGKCYRVHKPGRYALKDGRLSPICEGLVTSLSLSLSLRVCASGCTNIYMIYILYM